MNNFSIEHEGKIYWVSRSMAVVCFVFAYIDGRWCVLANQRGEGTPDFQGYWNAPCGYLDYNETLEQAAIREVYEETGVKLTEAKFLGYEDSPSANRQNVTFRFYSIIHNAQPSNISLSTEALGGEENEVASVSWIPVSNIKDFKWAFNHNYLINEIASTLGLLS